MHTPLRSLFVALSALLSSACLSLQSAAIDHRMRSVMDREREQTAPPLSPVAGQRKRFTYTHSVAAPAEDVFPLLCPVREYEWIDWWSCELVYSDSGVAEDGCVFRTRLGTGETWVVVRYDEEALSFGTLVFAGDHLVMLLEVELEELGEGRTEVRWSRTYTALDRLGSRLLASYDEPRVTAEMAAIAGDLERHLQGPAS